MSKKNKIIQRTISLMLCMALLFSSVNILGLFSNISAVEEEMATSNDGSKNKIIQKFYDENIIININSIDNVDIYLPSTIRAVYDDGSSDVIDAISWSQIKDCGLNEETDIHTYYYQAAIDNSYEIDSNTSLPVATVNVVTKPEISFLGDDVISDMGDFFVWINTLENDTAVCNHCFRELDANGLCPACGATSEECSCEEIDVDLNNIQSVEAWIAKYSPYHIKEDGQFYKVKILFYDDEWWENLKPNEKELAERIYSAIIYGYREYNYSIFEIDSTVSEALFFKEHNRSDKTWEEIFSFSPILKITTTEILKEAIEIDPNMTLGSLVSIADKRYVSEILDSDFMAESICGVTDLTEEKMNKIWELGGKFENLQNLTSLQKGRYTVITQTIGRERYSITYTGGNSDITASADASTSLGGSAWANDLSKGAFGISHIYKITGPASAAEFPLTFCLNHGKQWEDGTYQYSETKENRIGGIIEYINENYPNYTTNASHLKAYAVAQQVIWALIGPGQENTNCDSWAEVEDRLDNRKTLLGSNCVEFGKFLYGSISSAPSGYASGTIGNAEYKVYVYKASPTDHQPIAVLTGGIEVTPPTYEEPDEGDETFRTRLVVKPQLSSSISDSGTGVIATWKPNGSTHYRPSSLGEMATPCGSSDKKTWSIDTGTTTTYSKSDYVSVNWYDVDSEDGSISGSEPAFSSMFPHIIGMKPNHYDFSPSSTTSKSGVSYQWSTTQVSPDSGYSSVKKGAYQKNEDDVISTHFGVAKQNYSYTTFGSQYCSAENSHNVYKPVVKNYTLTLNYQGGWFNGSVNSLSTYDMNSPDYTSVDSFEDTHNASTHTTSNNVSTETTKVAFSAAEDTNTKLLSYRSSIANARSSSSYSWQDKGNYFSFKHSDKAHFDGNTVFVKFKYKNYYVVSLPTPVRTGYNFLGWYTDPENGEKVNPQTVSVNVTTGTYAGVYTTGNATFTNAYVIKADTTLYAHWELITKNEEFTVDWLDNGNSYTTRPKAILVELYRYADNKQDNPELCKGYISENVTSTTSKQTNWRGGRDVTNVYFTPDTNDWVYQFHNDSTGATVTKTDPNIRPTNTQNDVFYNGSSYVIRISPDDSNTSGTYSVGVTDNQWKVTLNNLQKYDTYQDSNHEYTYVIKAYTVESADTTTQYYISKNTSDNDYSTSADHYYNIQNNNINPNGQKTQNDYNNIAKKNLTKNLVCRLYNKSGNVAGEVLGTNPYWKSVNAIVTFKDVTDRYHFRPYSMIAELYQNIPNRKDTFQNNMMTDNSGVRTKVASQPIFYTSTNAYSSVSVGTITNVFFVSFKYLPTVQPTTCEKITYDVILTSGQDRYRYTIDSNSQYNNINEIVSNSGTSHDYAYHHKDITILNPYSVDNSVAGSYTGIASITDLNYNKMMNSAGNILNVIDTVYIGTTTTPQYTYAQMKPTGTIYRAHIVSAIIDGYEFVIDNTNGLYQSILNFNDYTVLNNGQYNTYSNGATASVNKSNYQSAYKSCAYNLRYYYITETINMRSNPNVYYSPILASTGHGIEQLNYMETLLWNFTVTLNGSDKTLTPTEYSGSNSADDRTGNYNGTTNDDYTHTNNKLTITSNVKNQSGNNISAENKAYKKLQIDQNQEGFLITLKQIKKNWTGSGDSTGENYINNSYSKNGYIYYYYDTSRNRLTRIFQPEATTPSGTGYTSVGNEYNVYVPANGSTTLEYLPDGKYEVTCHYDIDFSNFTFKATTGKTASIIKESNGKYYLTFSSATVKDNQDITHSATIDYWRGYVDDMNNFSWARPLRDNNFGLVPGTPSNVSDKTLYPFGNNDKKNEVTYGTKDVIVGTGYHAHDNYDDKNPSLNPYSSISNYFITKEYVLK